MPEEKTPKKSLLPLSLKGKGGEGRSAQLALLFAMAACCFIAFYLYRGTTQLIQASNGVQADLDASKLDTSVQDEAREVEATQSAAASIDKAEGRVMQSAMLAEVSGKQPFGTSSALIAPPPAAANEIQTVPLLPDVPAEIAVPPAVTVVAVMVRGNERVAMIDVAEEERGLVVREGSRFSGDSARITKINPEGVSFTWMRKNYEVTMPR